MPITQSETVRVLMQVLDRFDERINQALEHEHRDDDISNGKVKALEFSKRAMLDVIRSVMQEESQRIEASTLEIVTGGASFSHVQQVIDDERKGQ